MTVALFDRAIVGLLPAVPRPVVRRISSRYIAGPELADAIDVVRRLNAEGKLATIDVLGEAAVDVGEAAATADAYVETLRGIEHHGLDANVSLKPTAFALTLEPECCRVQLERVVREAAAHGTFVRIDMEDASTTDDTLRLYRDLREAGHENVGVVLQASLRRTPADVRSLTGLRANVRVCKGIYVEDASIQLKEDEAVRAGFLDAVDELVAAGSYVALATHDEVLVEQALQRLAGVPRDRYEFQMLLGVRPELGAELVAAGERLRVYVPFGRRWYEYSLRRLQENPRIAGYVAADVRDRLLRRRGRRRGRARLLRTRIAWIGLGCRHAQDATAPPRREPP